MKLLIKPMILSEVIYNYFVSYYRVDRYLYVIIHHLHKSIKWQDIHSTFTTQLSNSQTYFYNKIISLIIFKLLLKLFIFMS